MKITFRINYLTCYGQQLMIDSIPGIGVALMTPKQNGDWELTIDSDSLPQKTFSYKYLMKDNNVSQTLYEFGDRTFCLPELASDNILVRDYWKPNVSATNVMNSSAFKDVIFHREPVADFHSATVREENKAHLRLSISLTRVLPNHYVGVRFINSLVEKEAIIRLSDQYFPMWKCECTVNIPKQYSEYKYCICEKGTDKLILEEYVTRYFTPEEDKDFYILNDEDFKFPRYPWKGAGVAIPVFSLRSDEDFGVGEFMDLIPLIDWAKSVGLRMIQLLPVNDTVLTHTWKDSYPYNCVSVFALHPMYLRVSEMPKISSKVTEEILLEKKPALNQLKKIDYEEVMRVKSRIYKTIYDDNHRHFLQEPEYKEFFENNKQWLKPYAVFSYLRDLYNTPEFEKWGQFATYSPEMVDELCDENNASFDDVAVHFFIQYHLHLQLKKVSDHARQNGIILKGDIPIGISRNSVDAWVNPRLYNLDCQAGAL